MRSVVFDIRFMSTIQFHPRFFCTSYFLFESAYSFTNIRRMNNYCFIWPWKYLLTTHGSQQKHLRNKNNFCFGFCGEVCFCVLYIFFQSWMSPQNVVGWMVPLYHCQSRSVFVIISQMDMIDANMMPVYNLFQRKPVFAISINTFQPLNLINLNQCL